MSEKEARPGDLGETASEDIPQDPGVPGAKFPADEPGQGFEGDSPVHDKESRQRAAEADETFAPGSMPGGSEQDPAAPAH